MTLTPNTTQVFNARHENGTIWVLAANAKRGDEFMARKVKEFARNYCRKHLIPGTVTLTNANSGDVMIINVSDSYTWKDTK
jgi:hypothetical protein